MPPNARRTPTARTSPGTPSARAASALRRASAQPGASRARRSSRLTFSISAAIRSACRSTTARTLANVAMRRTSMVASSRHRSPRPPRWRRATRALPAMAARPCRAASVPRAGAARPSSSRARATSPPCSPSWLRWSSPRGIRRSTRSPTLARESPRSWARRTSSTIRPRARARNQRSISSPTARRSRASSAPAARASTSASPTSSRRPATATAHPARASPSTSVPSRRWSSWCPEPRRSKRSAPKRRAPCSAWAATTAERSPGRTPASTSCEIRTPGPSR